MVIINNAVALCCCSYVALSLIRIKFCENERKTNCDGNCFFDTANSVIYEIEQLTYQIWTIGKSSPATLLMLSIRFEFESSMLTMPLGLTFGERCISSPKDWPSEFLHVMHLVHGVSTRNYWKRDWEVGQKSHRPL